MVSCVETAASLQRELEALADPKTKAWWDVYVKDGAPFLGVKMAAVRRSMHEWYRMEVDGHLSPAEQKGLALALIREAHTEEKLAGMLFLQEILVPAGHITCVHDLRSFAALYADGFIYDWNVGDWFCIKVLGPLIERDGESCARAISAWCDAPNIWQARASVVSFVNLASERTYYPRILESCHVLIGREERFAKTAVGWVLRGVSTHDAQLVGAFVEEHLASFSLESARNALKHAEQDDRERAMAWLRASRQSTPRQ